MPDELRDLFRRDLERIDLPPATRWMPSGERRPSARQSFFALPAAAGMIALALVLAFVIQAARGQLPSQVVASPSPSASLSAPITATGGPPTRVPSVPSTAPSPLPTISGVIIRGTLPPTGRWALILTRTPLTITRTPVPNNGARSQEYLDTLSATSLDGVPGQNRAIPLLSYVSVVPGAAHDADNDLRQQISPEGHRIVLSVLRGETASARPGLVVVDLVRGTAYALASGPDELHSDLTPAWSPTSDRIAFVRVADQKGRDAGIQAIYADGAQFREILGPDTAQPEDLVVHSWTADGSAIAYTNGEVSGYYTVDAATGRTARIGTQLATGRGMGDWRKQEPAFAGSFKEGPSVDTAQIVVARSNGSNPNVVYGGPAGFTQPRWRPSSDDLLFVVDGFVPDPRTAHRSLVIGSAASTTPRVIVEFPSPHGLLAAWTPSGGEIVYLETQSVMATLHLVAADGSNDRVVEGYGGGPDSEVIWLDLAVLGL